MSDKVLGIELWPDRMVFHVTDDELGDIPQAVVSQRVLTLDQELLQAFEEWHEANPSSGAEALLDSLEHEQQGLLDAVQALYEVVNVLHAFIGRARSHQEPGEDEPSPYDNPKHGGLYESPGARDGVFHEP